MASVITDRNTLASLIALFIRASIAQKRSVIELSFVTRVTTGCVSIRATYGREHVGTIMRTVHAKTGDREVMVIQRLSYPFRKPNPSKNNTLQERINMNLHGVSTFINQPSVEYCAD